MTQDAFSELVTKVEALLFAYAEWLSVEDIKQAAGSDSVKLIENALKDLQKKYEEGYAFTVLEEESKWRMKLREEFEESVSELISGTEIPRNVLKVLSVIAYEQPITKTRLSEILGRSVKPEVDYLYKAKFVDYEKQGIGRYYRVTRKFFDYFKIEDEEAFRKEANEKLQTFLEEPMEEDDGEEEPKAPEQES